MLRSVSRVVFRPVFARAARSVTTAAARVNVAGRRIALTRGAGVVAVSGAALLLALQQKAKADNKVDWDAVRKEIVGLLESNPDYDDGSYGPLFVRLAWHASGTYEAKSKTGGSNGATMRYEPESKDGANAGLALARELLEKVQAKFPNASRADIWTLAGSVAIEEMGGPKINWVPGRTDATDAKAAPPNGRLPDATKKADHIRNVFYRMGLNDQEIVALAGAHCLGRCHKDRSGFVGPWTRAPTTFSTEYFRLLLEEKWTVKPNSTPLQYQDKSGDLMMLPADLAFIEDAEFKKWVEIYAKDRDRFFNDFAAAWKKLIEFNHPALNASSSSAAAPAGGKSKNIIQRLLGY